MSHLIEPIVWLLLIYAAVMWLAACTGRKVWWRLSQAVFAAFAAWIAAIVFVVYNP